MAKKKFTETPISICGKELMFKRCPAKTIKVYDEAIRDKAKSIEPLQKEVDKKSEEVEILENRIQNNQRKIDLIDRKEDATDEEIESSLKLLDAQEDLYNELKKAREDYENFAEEIMDDFNKAGDEMNELLAEKAEAMLDGITKEEFLESYDAVDIRIVTNLGKYYEMCIIGEKPLVIQREIQKDSREFNNIEESFRR